jgi:hypothetical protein
MKTLITLMLVMLISTLTSFGQTNPKTITTTVTTVTTENVDTSSTDTLVASNVQLLVKQYNNYIIGRDNPVYFDTWVQMRYERFIRNNRMAAGITEGLLDSHYRAMFWNANVSFQDFLFIYGRGYFYHHHHYHYHK